MRNYSMTLLLTVLSLGGLLAQQDAQYTQYMYNTMAVKPCLCGFERGFEHNGAAPFAVGRS